ncbi:hypothetical protein V5799_022785 [Amblyomma americanum]|uniref:Uncharacterized protein n=1 Tax=Amblyomma americanum TaxID=6943 RepID=A0AAQ4FJM0_AMBAM
MATAAARVDPDIVTFACMLNDEKDVFCREYGLLPPAPTAPPSDTQRHGRLLNTDYFWGVCGDLGFNPGKPTCTGSVVTRMGQRPKDPRSTFHCGTCRKELSQQNEEAVLHGRQATAIFFTFRDAVDPPHVKMSRCEILWLMYAAAKGMNATVASEWSRGRFKLGTEARTDWTNFIREVVAKDLLQRPRMGGPGEEVQVDESLFCGH